jgi:hypothetical protein
MLTFVLIKDVIYILNYFLSNIEIEMIYKYKAVARRGCALGERAPPSLKKNNKKK